MTSITKHQFPSNTLEETWRISFYTRTFRWARDFSHSGSDKQNHMFLLNYILGLNHHTVSSIVPHIFFFIYYKISWSSCNDYHHDNHISKKKQYLLHTFQFIGHLPLCFLLLTALCGWPCNYRGDKSCC